MKPDVIVAWPRNCDYPLWREMIEQNQDRFGKIIIVLTLAPGKYDFEKFVKAWSTKLDRCYAINSPVLVSGDDWRHVAVNYALDHSDSEWVWFTEQDFYFDADFWDLPDIPKFDYFGIGDKGRLHPCSLLIRRELLDKTSRNFAANPPHYDHFGKIQRDLESMSDLTSRILLDSLRKFSQLGEYNFVHFNGYSHNFRLVSEGEPANYRPDEFIKHMQKSLGARTVHDAQFAEIATKAIEAYERENGVKIDLTRP